MGKFEKFIPQRLAFTGEPTITIAKTGILNFNIVTMNRYVKDNVYAVLYYDKKSRLVGIKFTKRKAPEGYRIIKYRENKFGTISGMGFLKYYKIRKPETKYKTKCYLAEWNEQEEMLVIDLKEHKEKRNASKQLPMENDEESPFG